MRGKRQMRHSKGVQQAKLNMSVWRSITNIELELIDWPFSFKSTFLIGYLAGTL